jgi:hypothetical protein
MPQAECLGDAEHLAGGGELPVDLLEKLRVGLVFRQEKGGIPLNGDCLEVFCPHDGGAAKPPK